MLASLPRMGDGVSKVLHGVRHVPHSYVEQLVREELVHGVECKAGDWARYDLGPNDVQKRSQKQDGIQIVKIPETQNKYNSTNHGQGSISPTFFKQLFCAQILKAQKNSQLKRLFAISGSSGCKSWHVNTLMQLFIWTS